MNSRRLCVCLFIMGAFFHADAVKDSTKVKYIHSFISIEGGIGKNIYTQQGWEFKPGIVANVSGLIALKETYFGIALLAGYNLSPYTGTNYESVTGKIESFYQGESAGSINEGYVLAGLAFKVPEHTTRYAIELRLMVGTAYCTFPGLTYYSASLAPWGNYANNIRINADRQFSFGVLDAGIGYGYKISQHWGYMGYCDWMYVPFKSSGFIINNINLSAGLVYTFGTMMPNFVY